MITNAIIDFLWGFAAPILNQVPAIELNTVGVWDTGLQWIQAALYFFPLSDVVAIFAIVLKLWMLRVAVAFLHSLWSALPIL